MKLEEIKQLVNEAIKKGQKFKIEYTGKNGVKKPRLIEKISSIHDRGFCYNIKKINYGRINSIEILNGKLETSAEVTNQKVPDYPKLISKLNEAQNRDGYSKAIITKIQDGDGGEFLLSGEAKSCAFRIKFIDAPETNEKDKELKKLGEECTKFLLQQIGPETVVYFKDYQKTRDGRLLVEIFLINKENETINIGATILEKGYAIPLFIKGEVTSEQIEEYKIHATIGFENELGVRNCKEMNATIFQESLKPQIISDSYNGDYRFLKSSFINKYKHKKQKKNFIRLLTRTG